MAHKLMLILFVYDKGLERDDTDAFLSQKSSPRLPSTVDTFALFHRSSTGSHSPASLPQWI